MSKDYDEFIKGLDQAYIGLHSAVLFQDKDKVTPEDIDRFKKWFLSFELLEFSEELVKIKNNLDEYIQMLIDRKKG